MKNMRIPAKLQHSVINYLLYTQSNLDKQNEMQSFKQMISPSLKDEITGHVVRKIISQNPIFKNSSEKIINFMLRRVNTTTAPPEEVMIKQGDDPDFLYLISKGEVEVSVTDQHNDEEMVVRLREGDLFGEVALLHNIKRTASVSCLNYCTFATFTGEDFKEVCRAFPSFNREIRKKKNKYKDKWKDFCRSCIL